STRWRRVRSTPPWPRPCIPRRSAPLITTPFRSTAMGSRASLPRRSSFSAAIARATSPGRHLRSTAASRRPASASRRCGRCGRTISDYCFVLTRSTSSPPPFEGEADARSAAGGGGGTTHHDWASYPPPQPSPDSGEGARFARGDASEISCAGALALVTRDEAWRQLAQPLEIDAAGAHDIAHGKVDWHKLHVLGKALVPVGAGVCPGNELFQDRAPGRLVSGQCRRHVTAVLR